jgi:UDP-N-acetyl-2-amino-2-deoxyglucuronate dehydrogenase
MAKNFAITGVAGYIAPRHLQAIKETGNRLVAALDPHDSVGILDSYFMDARFFTEYERFDRHLEKLRRLGDEHRIHFVSICSPNYLHDAHIRTALRAGADALCEKPLVINPWNLEALQRLEEETGRRVYTVLQLRLHPAILALKEKIAADTSGTKHEIDLAYITSRGAWYDRSWKGDVERSGGLATNIGVHFFDMLTWIFGRVEYFEVHHNEPHKVGGYLELERARVRWVLSIDIHDVPLAFREKGQRTFRSLTIDGAEFEFSEGFTNLHTMVYRDILEGRGFGIDDARQSIQLVHNIRNAAPLGVRDYSHPFLKRSSR